MHHRIRPSDTSILDRWETMVCADPVEVRYSWKWSTRSCCSFGVSSWIVPPCEEWLTCPVYERDWNRMEPCHTVQRSTWPSSLDDAARSRNGSHGPVSLCLRRHRLPLEDDSLTSSHSTSEPHAGSICSLRHRRCLHRHRRDRRRSVIYVCCLLCPSPRLCRRWELLVYDRWASVLIRSSLTMKPPKATKYWNHHDVREDSTCSDRIHWFVARWTVAEEVMHVRSNADRGRQ